MAEFWNGYLLPLLIIVGKILLFVVPLLLSMAYVTYGERRIIGAMQMRKGPNVVGPFGLFQPFADAVKLVFSDGHSTGIFTWRYMRKLTDERGEIWMKYLESLTARGLSR